MAPVTSRGGPDAHGWRMSWRAALPLGKPLQPGAALVQAVRPPSSRWRAGSRWEARCVLTGRPSTRLLAVGDPDLR